MLKLDLWYHKMLLLAALPKVYILMENKPKDSDKEMDNYKYGLYIYGEVYGEDEMNYFL